MTKYPYFSRCPVCDLEDLPFRSEEGAVDAVESHNEAHHGGEDVARVVEVEA